MSIHALSGKPGAGKGLFAMRLLVRELRSSDRYIVTNLGVKVEALADYLHKTYGQTFNMVQRLTVLPDHDVCKFWLFRGNGVVLPDEERPDYCAANAKNTWELPSFDESTGASVVRVLGGRGVVYFLDELQLFFNAREWSKTGKAAMYYLSQHRHSGDDIIWMTQFVDNVDKQFRSLTQDFTYLRNHKKEKFASVFKSVPWFSFKTFLSPVNSTSVNVQPTEQGRFLLDVKGLASCYDTAKGVGLMGGVAADTKEKKRGLPFWCVPIAIVLFGVLVFVAFKLGTSGLMSYMKHVAFGSVPKHLPVASTNAVSHAVVPDVASGGTAPVARHVTGRVKSAASSSGDPDEGVAMVAMVKMPDRWIVFLSDGRKLQSTDPEFEVLTEQGVKYAGKYYHRVLTSHDSPVEKASVTAVSPARPVDPPKPIEISQTHPMARVHMQSGETLTVPLTQSSVADQ